MRLSDRRKERQPHGRNDIRKNPYHVCKTYLFDPNVCQRLRTGDFQDVISLKSELSDLAGEGEVLDPVNLVVGNPKLANAVNT